LESDSQQVGSDSQAPGAGQAAQRLTNCGQSQPGTVEGVSPGPAQASFGELPWQAVVFYSNQTFVCGGSLVSDRHVVLAAHCLMFVEPEEIVVRLGEYQLSTDSEPETHQDMGVTRIHMHPGFRQGPLFSDVAVLELTGPARLSRHVQPICLPRPEQDFTGSRCLAAGWGRAAFDSGLPALPAKIESPVVDHRQCQSRLQKTRLGTFFKLDESFICAGGESGADACKGDGGGPLACPVDGRYVLAGISSWGVDCGEPGVPAVFASTTAALGFLQRAMGIAAVPADHSDIQRGDGTDGSTSYGR